MCRPRWEGATGAGVPGPWIDRGKHSYRCSGRGPAAWESGPNGKAHCPSWQQKRLGEGVGLTRLLKLFEELNQMGKVHPTAYPWTPTDPRRVSDAEAPTRSGGAAGTLVVGWSRASANLVQGARSSSRKRDCFPSRDMSHRP